MSEEEQEGAVDEEAMMAEWEAMAEEGADGDEGGGGGEGGEDGGEDGGEGEQGFAEEGSGRVLDQDEIDSLLGFDGGEEEGDKRGIHALINSALVAYERLPMLDIIFDRMVRMMSTSLRNFTSDNIEVSLDNITSVRFGDYLNSIPLPAMLAVFRAEQWDNYGLMTIDSNLIYSVVDVLLGGRRGTAAMRIEGRPYTTIEQNLIERMISVVLKDMSAAFEPLSPVNFSFDRLETNPRFATIARPPNAAILIKLRVDMEDRGGRLEMLYPYATLEPIRELLLQRFMGEKFGRDTIWESHLAAELWQTEVPLTAVLDEQSLTLREVMNLEVGQTLIFNKTPDDAIDVRCGGIPMVEGRMGRAGKRIAIRVERSKSMERRAYD